MLKKELLLINLKLEKKPNKPRLLKKSENIAKKLALATEDIKDYEIYMGTVSDKIEKNNAKLRENWQNSGCDVR